MRRPTAIERVLVVEDNAPLRDAIAKTMRQLGAKVVEAGTAREAIECLRDSPDLVIADVCLPDDSALALFEAARGLVPEPMKIGISGRASAQQAFDLSQLGVRAYLAKPFSLRDLREAVDRLRNEAPALEPVARATVGRVSLREVTSRMRNAMIDEALARSGGSRSGAARLLEVSRQAVQQIVRQVEDGGQARYPERGSSDRAAPRSPVGE
jgi:DNA-binding NtrC family response regulator